VRAFLAYALVAGAVVAVGAAVVGWLAPSAGRELWFAAALAYPVQLAAFGALVGMRGAGKGFFVAWGGGTLLRLIVVLGAGLWVSQSGSYRAAPLLLGLAGFLFALLLLEPVFFRMGMRGQ
jgi:hypothetical protein